MLSAGTCAPSVKSESAGARCKDVPFLDAAIAVQFAAPLACRSDDRRTAHLGPARLAPAVVAERQYRLVPVVVVVRRRFLGWASRRTGAGADIVRVRGTPSSLSCSLS